ncbi:DNA polymerase/3'-5' exonuclease PolX [subsurface metagenome]
MEGKIALERAEKIANEVVKRLSPYCQKIEVAGSVRRRKPWVNDVDLVLVPSDLWNLHHEIMGMGQMRMSGNKIMRVVVGNTQVDIYVASEETFATLLLIRTGSAENNIRLATLAKKRGWHLAASGDGLFNENGERIAGDSERSIFEALGLKYREPWERD